MGKGIENVGKDAFEGCSSLKYVIFPHTQIKDISKYFSFTEASLTSNSSVFVATGDVITVSSSDYVIEFECVVRNDTNGDGVCDALDAAQVANASNGLKSLGGAYAMAADSNRDDEIDIMDYQAIVNKVIA